MTSLFPEAIALDPEATAIGLRSVPPPDLACCNACATFTLIVREGLFPATLQDFLRHAGIDPTKPLEVWGAPDAGFLGGWWVFAGSLGDVSPDDHGLVAQPDDGLTCTLSDQLSMAPPPSLAGHPLLQLEFAWTSDRLRDLEQVAWPVTDRVRGV